MFDARELHARYADRVILHQVSVAVQRGEWVALIGPNGAGKSTLLKAMLGLVELTTGARSVDGQDVRSLSREALAAKVAYVPQKLESVPPFTIGELVLQGRYPHQRGFAFETQADRLIAARALRAVGVFELVHRRLDEVSGGEAQRALIASAIAQEADYLLLDEPTSGLDLHHGVQILDILQELRTTSQVGILMASHDINLVSRYCDRIVLLVDGRIAAQGPPGSILSAAQLEGSFGEGLDVLEDPAGGAPFVVPKAGAGRTSRTAAAPPPEREAEPRRAESGSMPSDEQRFSLDRRRWLRALGLGVAALLLALVLCPLFGASWLNLGDAWREGPSGTSVDATIFWNIRLPRVLLAMLAGGALAVAGATFQALLRNGLATPYTLGVAGGASLGAVLAIKLGLAFVVLGFSATPLFAFAGAFASVLAVYALARAMGRADSTELLLAGIAWSIVSSAFVLLLQYLSDPAAAFQMIRWLVGGFDVVGYVGVVQTAPFIFAGAFALLALSRKLNLLSVDEGLAAARGVDVPRTRTLAFAAASLVTAAAVAQVGPIGFVGLLVPHASRALFGSDNRLLIPLSLLFGAAFLAFADAFARSIVAPAELPVGVITALLGGPTLVFILVRSRR